MDRCLREESSRECKHYKVVGHRILKNRNRRGGSVEWNRRAMGALNDLALLSKTSIS